MAVIVIEPLPIELGFHREQYDALVRDVREAGHRVTLKTPEQFRSIDPGTIARAAFDVAIHVADEAEGEVYAAIGAYLFFRLRGAVTSGPRKGERRRAVIYGPRGRIVREIELPDDPESGP